MSNWDGRGHIDLEQDGLPGQWVDLVDVALKSPRQFRALQRIPTDPAALVELTPEAANEAARLFLGLCVSSWCIKDPETGELLPPANSPALEPDRVPALVSARITAVVRERMEELSNLKALLPKD